MKQEPGEKHGDGQDMDNPLSNEDNRWLSLPLELTTAIFLVCHATDSTVRDLLEGVNSSQTRLPTEFVLSSICRDWRSLALDMPDLWKRFIYTPSGRVDCPPEKLELYEGRSGGQLEDIYLNFLSGSSEDDFYGFLNDLLQQHNQSLRRFVLIGEGGLEMGSILTEVFKDASMPNLEYYAVVSDMVLDVAADLVEIEFLNTFQFTNGAPKLKYLYCNGVMAAWGLPPTNKLTTLRIEGGEPQCTFSLDVLHEVFSFPLLENISLSIPEIVQYTPEDNPNSPITARRLRNLRLCNTDLDDDLEPGFTQFRFEDLLLVLRAPALEYVTLKNFSAVALNKLQASSKSFPTVHDLILINCDTSNPSHCLVFKTLFPSVQSLTVWGNSGTMQLFAMWPSLKRVTVDDVFSPGIVSWPEPTSNRTLRVPRRTYTPWKEANEQRHLEMIEPMEIEEHVLPRHWPQNDLESLGFLPMTLDCFYHIE